MAPGHGRGQGFSQQGQLSAHTAGVETTGKQVRGRPLEQLAKDWRCQKQAPTKNKPGGRARRTCRQEPARFRTHRRDPRMFWFPRRDGSGRARVPEATMAMMSESDEESDSE